MLSAVSYSFASCVIDKSTREIRLHGVLQLTTPRVFDLIVYLVEHRNRVVPKHELVDRLWSGAVLSSTVIASTVMKARQAIGDLEGQLIKTVHRVGYRFVGELCDPAPGAPGAAKPPTAEPLGKAAVAQMRLALLPFDNRTGDARFGWLELGLLSMVNHALENDPRLSVFSVTSVLKGLEHTPAGLAFEDKVATLCGLIGAEWVGQAVVGRDGDGFVLDYRIASAAKDAFAGHLQGDELTDLGQQLAKAIDAHLFVAGPASVAFHSDDPLANQLFARAAQAFQQGRFQQSLHLIQVVMDLCPDQPIVRLEHIRVLEKLAGDGVVPLGQRLLADAVAAGDNRLAARVHAVLANAFSASTGNSTQTRHHLDEALRLVGPHRLEEWAADIYGDCGFLATSHGDYERARELFNLVVLCSGKSGNLVQQQLAAYRLAGLEAMDGKLLAAQGIWAALLDKSVLGAHPLGREVGLHMNLSAVEADLGRFDRAMAHCDKAFELLPHTPNHQLWVIHLVGLCVWYAQAGRLEAIDRALALGSADLAAARGRQLACVMVARSQRSACMGELGQAAELLRAGIDTALQANQQWDAAQWAPVLVQTLMKSGRFDEAERSADALLGTALLQSAANLAGIRLHAQALALHRRGDMAGARDKLAGAVRLMRPGRWSALARIDAAWLDIEHGDLAAAGQVMAGAFFWLKEHPLGMAIDARLHHAAGARAAAIETQKRAMAKTPTVSPAATQLLRFYADAAQGAAPLIGSLPSVM